jgi:hypothetical protein
MTTSTVAASQDRDRVPDWRYDAACRGGLTENERRRRQRRGSRRY